MPFFSGLPNVISNIPSAVWLAPERPRLEIASDVNKVFNVGRQYQGSGAVQWGVTLRCA
jgi:hypothetical protein